jgi:hypothetical protein
LVGEGLIRIRAGGGGRHLGKGKRQNIGSHLQCFLPDGFRIIVDALIFPAISQISFKRIEANQSALINDPKSLRRFAIVFMDFRETLIEVIFLVVNGVIKR